MNINYKTIRIVTGVKTYNESFVKMHYSMKQLFLFDMTVTCHLKYRSCLKQLKYFKDSFAFFDAVAASLLAAEKTTCHCSHSPRKFFFFDNRVLAVNLWKCSAFVASMSDRHSKGIVILSSNNNTNNKVIYTAQIRRGRKCAFSRQFWRGSFQFIFMYVQWRVRWT